MNALLLGWILADVFLHLLELVYLEEISTKICYIICREIFDDEDTGGPFC